ncbi:MAG: hypothetical protein ABUL54_11210 [Dongia sp.]
MPMMDGPLKPNTALDEAPIVLRAPEIDNLTVTQDGLLASQGASLLTLTPRGDALVSAQRQVFEAPIASLASDGRGAVAVGLDGVGVRILGGAHDGVTIVELGGGAILCSPTAAVFADPDTLLVANGAVDAPASEWKRDLMNRRASGSVWRVTLGSAPQAVPLARNLAFPDGLALGKDGTVLVSEAWRHRVTAVDAATPKTVLSELPAYPSRIVAAEGGGYWLALFAPRNQLVEFVLREEGYRRRMVETIDPAYWIAPALSSGASFLEPIQGGARKKLNMLKPWSPSWSYGLVVRCDAAMRPLASFHSRADGSIHGVTSLAEINGRLLVGAKGSGVVVALGPDAQEAAR